MKKLGNRTVRLAFVAIGVLLSHAMSGSAALFVDAPNTPAADCVETGTSELTLDCDLMIGNLDVRGDARALHGSVGARAEISTTNADAGGVVRMTAVAEFSDTLTITGAALPNGVATRAFIDFDLETAFTLTSPPLGSGQVFLQHDFEVFFKPEGLPEVLVNPIGGLGLFPNGIHSYPVDMIPGSLYDIRARLLAQVECVDCGNGATAEGILDALNTASLSVISLQDFGPNDFIVEGEVGGYANVVEAVPEPSAPLLLCLGWMILLVVRRSVTIA